MQQMIINMQQKPVTYIYLDGYYQAGVKRIILGINKH